MPRRTLARHLRGAVRRPGVVTLESKTTQFEQELVTHVQYMESAMYCLTMLDLRKLAFDLAVRAKIVHPFDLTIGLAGLDWARAFLGRHRNLTIRRPIATSLARINGFNKDAVAMFFNNYRRVLIGGEFGPLRIWYCDETGFTTVAKPVKVICTTGVNQVRKASSAERGKNVTALGCMSAVGTFVPPLFVFPRKRMLESLMNGSLVGSIGTVNERASGYIDSALFLRWMHLFVATVGCSKESPHLLLLDGHASHTSLDIILYAIPAMAMESAMDLRLIQEFSGDGSLNVIEWLEKAELVCNL